MRPPRLSGVCASYSRGSISAATSSDAMSTKPCWTGTTSASRISGTPRMQAYQGEQDADPPNATDCDTASDQGTFLHAAEFEVFGQDGSG